MADNQLTCRTCGSQFIPSIRTQVYCSRGCKERRPRVRTPQKPLAEVHTCLACDRPFHPKAKDRTKFCGRECGLKWPGLVARARANGCRIIHTVDRLRCISCRKWFSRESGRRLKCAACAEAKPPSAYKPVKGTVRECAGCKTEFIAMGGGEFSSLKFCSKACKNADMRKRPGHREAQKAAKARRRARKKGAAVCERVSPLRVFERDAWRCGICGQKTLRSKRGTTHPRAPELDHIVALALGGSHTYGNTMCACRSCNIAKGAAALGQLPLFSYG